MNVKAARALSFVLHPSLMPTYGVFLIFKYNAYLRYSFPDMLTKAIISIVFITTFLLPTLAAYLLLKKGLINSFQMDTKEERLLPFISTSISYCLGFYLLNRLYLPPVFNLLILGATVAVIFATIISVKWKISIHMIGIGGILGAMIGLSQRLMLNLEIPIVLLILLCGILGTARLSLNAHNPIQVYTGFLVGVFTGLVMLFL